jgi:hypothetical protein
LGVVAVGDSPRKALHGGSARLVGNDGAEPVVGSRWPENWSASTGFSGEAVAGVDRAGG